VTGNDARTSRPAQLRPPQVTIGVPVFNGAVYLASALDSLLGQTFHDLEIVVSDNASTDETAAIARAYAALDPRIRVIESRVNVGGYRNFMRVLEVARGDYFKWAACDDLCEPRFVERCVEVLDRDPSLMCCHARTVKIDPAGRPVPGLPDPTRSSASGSDPRPHVRFRDVLLHTGYAARSFGLIRAAALRACRPLLPIYGSEKVLMAELALRGRYHDIDDVLFYERVHPQSASALGTVSAQQEFAAASSEGGRLAPRLGLLAGYVGAVRRAPLPAGEKARCGLAILAYLFQVRKWRRVARSVIAATGTGGHQPAEVAAASEVDYGQP
jgi:hypothetical protein